MIHEKRPSWAPAGAAMSAGIIVLVFVLICLSGCSGNNVAIGDNNDQTVHIEKHVVHKDTTAIIGGTLVLLFVLAMITAGFARSGPPPPGRYD
jgi:hypothetical protein